MKTKTKIFIATAATLIIGSAMQFVSTFATNSSMTVGMQIAAPIDLTYEQEYLELYRGIQLSWNLPEQTYVDGFNIYEYIGGSLSNTYTLTGSELRSYTVEGTVTDNTEYKYIIKSFLAYTGSTALSACATADTECEITFNSGVAPDLSSYCSGGTAIGVSRVPLSFSATGEGKLNGLISDAGQGKYLTNIYDLGESNKNGSVGASYMSINGNSVSYNITGNNASTIDFVVHKKEMYNDLSSNQIASGSKGNQTQINVFVRDQYGRPVISGKQVQVKRVDNSSTSNLCTTDENGKCSGTYTVPTTAFDSGGTFGIKLMADAVETAQYDFTINQKSSDLSINDLRAGMILPDAQLFQGTQFIVPVYIKAVSENIISYQFEFNYDANLFEPVMDGSYPKVTAGSNIPWLPNTNLTSGKISFSANANSSADYLSGTNLHAANIWMKVKTNATQGNSGNFTAKLVKLENPSPRTVAENVDVVMKDLSYTGSSTDYSGSMTVRLVKESGFIASGGEFQLFNTQPLTNTDVTTPITLTSYYNNSTSSGTTPASCVSNNSGIADITGTCTIRAKGAGNTYVDVTKSVDGSNVTRKVYTNVFHPVSSNPYDIEFDNKLEYISEISDYQKSDVKFKTTFTDGNGDITIDATDLVNVSISGGNFSYSNKQISRSLEGAGEIVVKQAGTATELRRENILSSNSSDVVTVKKLLVLLPKTITVSMTGGTSFLPGLSKKEASAKVESQLTSEGDSLISYVYLDLNDGNIQKINSSDVNFYAYHGSGNLALTGSDTISVSSGGTVTALTVKGLGIVRAELKTDANKKGDGYTCANLPNPVSITVTPTINLAENANSPVISHKGYQTSGNISVTANYQNLSTRSFTSDSRTSYYVLTGTGKYTLSQNTVSTANNGTASGSQVLTVVDFGGGTVFTGITTVNVVGVTGVNIASYEHYTPSGNARNDTTLNKIENSNTYQNAYLQATENYSDGSTQTITNFSDVYFFTDNSGVVNYGTAMKNFLTPQSVGSANVSIQSGLSTQSGTYVYRAETGINVSNTSVDINNFYLNFDGSPTYSLHGYKDQATKNILGYVEFSDTARRYIMGNQVDRGGLISGLLNFTSSSGAVSTITSGGQMTLKGNGVSNIQAEVAQDTGNTAPTWSGNIAGNLYANVGDVDLGESTGLPLNSASVSSGANVTVKVRMNAGSYSLGSFTLEILYDPNKLQYVSASKGAGLSSSFVISPNGTAGTRDGKTILSIPGYEAGADESTISSSSDIVNITFKSITSNLSGTDLGGKIVEIMGNDGTVEIAKNTNIVAGNNIYINGTGLFTAYKENKGFFAKIFAFIKSLFGFNETYVANIFDSSYTDAQPKIGDINNTCEVTSGDSRGVQLYLVNRLTTTQRENLLGDAFPNLMGTGGIAGSDAIHINETISRIKHYLEGVTASRTGSEVTIRAYIIDANQNPVKGAGIEVKMETAPGSGGTGTLYTMTNNGTDKYYEYKITNAPSSGGIIIHLRDNNSTSPITVAFKGSKILDSGGTFDPIAYFDDQDTEGHFNTIYGKDLPVGCGSNTNFPPTSINLSPNYIPANSVTGTTVGGLSAVSYDNGTHTYELVSGFGDNDKFTIEGNQLKINQSSGTGTYKLRIKTTDNGSQNATNVLWYEQQFTVTSSGAAAANPTVISFNKTIDEEEVFTFSGAAFSGNFILGSGGIGLEKIKITTLPTNGDLYTGGTVTYSGRDLITTGNTKITATGTEITYDEISSLQYVPDLDMDTTDSFGWNGFDGSYYAETGATVGFSINPVGDTPIVGTGSTYAFEQTQSGIVISRNTEDGNEVTHYRITNIISGNLYKSDGVTQIGSGDYITVNEGVLGLKFTSTSTENGYFDVESAHGIGDVSPQSGKARVLIVVIPVGDVTCGAPGSIQFTNTVSSSEDNPITYDFTTGGTGSYFWCEDMRGSSTYGWKLSIHISDLAQSGTIISPIDAYSRIKIYKGSSTGILTLTGSVHSMIETEINNNEQRFGSGSINSLGALKVITKGDGTNVTGKWAVQPTIKTVIPGYQNLGSYQGTITLTLDKNIAF